jgi:hypothetical protein
VNVGLYVRSGPRKPPRFCPDHDGAAIHSRKFGSGCLSCRRALRYTRPRRPKRTSTQITWTVIRWEIAVIAALLGFAMAAFPR